MSDDATGTTEAKFRNRIQGLEHVLRLVQIRRIGAHNFRDPAEVRLDHLIEMALNPPLNLSANNGGEQNKEKIPMETVSPETSQAPLHGEPLSKTAVSTQLAAVTKAATDCAAALGVNGKIMDPVLAELGKRKHEFEHRGLDGVKSLRDEGMNVLDGLIGNVNAGMTDADKHYLQGVQDEMELLWKIMAQPIHDRVGSPGPTSATPGATPGGGHTLYPDPRLVRTSQVPRPAPAPAANGMPGTHQSSVVGNPAP